MPKLQPEHKLGLFIMALVILLACAVIVQLNSHTLASVPPKTQTSLSPDPSPAQNQALGARTKTAGCVIRGALQDPSCTPGAVLGATKDQICTPGYAKSVRNVPEAEKAAVYAEYGITSHSPGQYEVDHLVSLELGGSNDISNLWPEAAVPAPGFHQKDVVENSLHDEVCAGKIPLAQAQQEIAGNWLAIYNGTASTASPNQ